MPRNEDRVRRDLEILGLELSASEGTYGRLSDFGYYLERLKMFGNYLGFL